MGIKARAIGAAALVVLLAFGPGCGRKLPPLPPGQGDPVEIVSMDFLKDGSVEAKAHVYIPGGTVTLLGKPKGLCPICTDDLRKRDEKAAEEKGVITLKDPAPESGYMVYRFSFQKGTTKFMTDPRVVRK